MMRPLLRLVALLISYCCLSITPVAGQDSAGITVEKIYSDETTRLFASPSYKWLDDGRLVLLDARVDTADRTF